VNTNTLEQNKDIRPAAELPRLAFSIDETAQMLGLCYMTVYRLIQRGKLKTIPHLRHKLIPRVELEKFIAEAN
jgi:excisionase family DNA binding protein